MQVEARDLRPASDEPFLDLEVFHLVGAPLGDVLGDPFQSLPVEFDKSLSQERPLIGMRH
jgi:hypothetical protein